jgi:hypothetical protein
MIRDHMQDAEDLRRDVIEAVSATAMSEASVEDWDQTVLEYGRATRYRPATVLLGDLVDDFRELPALLLRHHSASAQLRLTRVTAEMAGLVFLTLCKLDQRAAACSWACTARVAADEAGDRALKSWVRAQEAYLHYYSGDPREAVMVARHAQDVAGQTPCVGVALAAALEARAYGVLGVMRDTHTAIERAEAALEALSSESVTASAFGYNEAQLRFHQGNALTHLHDTGQAWPAQARALYPDSNFLDRALVRLDRASCLAHDGEPEAAMVSAGQTLLALTSEQRAALGRGEVALASPATRSVN